MKNLFRLFLLVLFALPAWADETEENKESSARSAGHSLHGEAFNEGPRQKAYLMGGMPKIDFPITTSVSEAQQFFNTLICYELWDELIALSETVYLEPTQIPEEQVKRWRALGLAYFSKGDTENGTKQIAELEAMLKKQKEGRVAAADNAEAKARKDKLSEEKVAKAMADALQAHSKSLEAVQTALAELRGHAALAQGNEEAALDQFEQVKDLPKERLARLHWQMGDKEKAERLAREAVEKGTNRVQILANYANLLWRDEKPKEAQEVFEKLRALSSTLDLEMPVFQRLKPIAQSLNLPEDWRQPAQATTDVGDRPSLNSLGPFRWRPSPAPDWSLQGADGETISLKDYRGKPVLVVFYLGYGCPHCIDQLNAFAPMAQEFAEAGIALVAISTDTPEGLKKTFAKSKADGTFPFPLVSDHALSAFKAYRAFDDFENAPLHGTFLVDGNGLVRWQDISYEPFQEIKFLLDESKRLLNQAIKAHLAGLEPSEDAAARGSQF